MKKKIRILITLLAGIALLQACAQELPGDGQPVPLDRKLSLQLIVSSPATATTRAGAAALATLENRIDTLEVLFFANDVCVWHPESVTYNATTGSVSFPQPAPAALMDGTTSYTVWVIANKSLEEMTGDSLNVLKNRVVSDDFIHNGMAPPSPLVMEGTVVTTLTSAGQHLGTVTLQRVFAKITIRIKTGGNITPNLNGGVPQVALQNYKTEATLIYNVMPPENRPLKSDGFIAADSIDGEWLTTDYPFYVCPYRWTADQAFETFFLVKIPQTVAGVTRDHYYMADFNYQILEGSTGMVTNHSMDRNHHYTLELFIDQPGGTAEVPQSLTGNHTITNWTTHEVYGSITSEIYLSLSEQTIHMDNVASYTFRYSSSLSTVSVKDVTYTGSGVPTFTVASTDATSGTITIQSAIPTNYQPKLIAFTVTNKVGASAGLDVRVEVTQTPPITITLFTATKSSTYLEPTALMSKNSYLITSAVSAVVSNRIVAYPLLVLDEKGNGYTLGTSENALMVSPRLMVASGLCDTISGLPSYAKAKAYCINYWETISNGTTYSDWRLPTLEELKLIDQLQDGSVISPAMSATYYWDAQDNDGPYNMSTGGTNNSGITPAMIRCVRDVK